MWDGKSDICLWESCEPFKVLARYRDEELAGITFNVK
jgi:hypothetical protein